MTVSISLGLLAGSGMRKRLFAFVFKVEEMTLMTMSSWSHSPLVGSS